LAWEREYFNAHRVPDLLRVNNEGGAIMSILKLKPACTNYLWGGTKLRKTYGIQSELTPLAEAWMLSCHKDGPSTVENGPDAGMTLPQYIQKHGSSILGKYCAQYEEFPILIKLIDAKQDLSIQVHPDDAYAKAKEGQYGKTEMWYVVEAEPGASLYYGFKHYISKEEYRQRIQNNTLTEVLNKVPVKKGNVFYIPAGTVHAIGKGLLIAEVQQNSNVTYRVYDYGRVGPDGVQRPLHIAKALDVSRREPPCTSWDFGGHMVQCAYFTADSLTGAASGVCDEISFTSFLVMDGVGTLRCGGEELPICKGDSVLLPAGSGRWNLRGTATVLLCRVNGNEEGEA
jgi:mannose-6-phosphate isomerase